MIVEMFGIKPMSACVGGMFSMMLAVGLTEHAGVVETITAGGLGAALSAILIRWILSQYNTAISRLSKLEDERAVIIRETVTALTHVTEQIGQLVSASHERGEEVRELVNTLKGRTCMALTTEEMSKYKEWKKKQ